MSDPEIPPAEKARTIAHMNKDHRHDLRLILLHHHHKNRLSPELSLPQLPIPASVPREDTSADTDADADADTEAATNAQADPATDPLLLDLDLDRLTLRLPHANAVYTVPFEPPLRSWAERRERLVAMARDAREGLRRAAAEQRERERERERERQREREKDKGKDGEKLGESNREVTVDEYMPPRWPYDAAVFAAVLVYYVVFGMVRAGVFDQDQDDGVGGVGAAARAAVEAVRFPHGLAGFRWLVDAIFVPVLGIHLTETWWLERTRLRRFGVPRGSRVWWLWVGSVFIEGAMAFKRFDIVVERLRAKRR